MQQVGPYQLVRQIAVGGMAEVYLAKMTGIAGFERYVALKMIHPNLAHNQDFVEMLVREAKIAVQLSHPNIAQTFDLGCVDDTYYLAMEYVEGLNLWSLIKAARSLGLALPFDACAFIARELLAGLDHAHAKRGDDGQLLGIIHRDVSSDNVLISNAGAVKLVDFGIAKASSMARQTEAGVIKGKFAYMSPEQVSGLPLDATSDIYSAGVVLYEMLTGRTLYQETNLHQLALRIHEGVFTRPSLLRAETPPQLEQIVMRALARDRKDRYQSAGEMAVDLQEFLQSYSPAFVTATLGSLLGVLVDRTRVAELPAAESAASATPAKAPATEPPAKEPDTVSTRRRRVTPNVIRRVPRASQPLLAPEELEVELEIEIDLDDPATQIEHWIAQEVDGAAPETASPS